MSRLIFKFYSVSLYSLRFALAQVMVTIFFTSASAFGAPTCEDLFRSSVPSILSPSSELFPNREFAVNYTDIIRNLKVGDVVTLPDARRLQVGKMLGEGQLTYVFELEGGWALRLPKAYSGTNKWIGEEGMRSFLQYQKQLKELGVPVVDVDEQRSDVPFGIVVRRLEFQIEGRDFDTIRLNRKKFGFSKKQISDAEDALIEFFAKTWQLSSIADFGMRQLGYDGRQWILFDVGGVLTKPQQLLANFKDDDYVGKTMKVSDSIGKYTIREIPKDLQNRIAKAISSERKKHRKLDSWYQRDSHIVNSSLISGLTKHPLNINTKLHYSKSRARMCWRGLSFDENLIELDIENYLGDTNGIAQYKVVLRNQDQQILGKATLGLAIDEPSNLDKVTKKAEKSNRSFLRGDDFILLYDESTLSSHLVSTHELSFVPAVEPQ